MPDESRIRHASLLAGVIELNMVLERIDDVVDVDDILEYVVRRRDELIKTYNTIPKGGDQNA